MEPASTLKDFGPSIAIAISLVSLALSISTTRFNRRVKVAEMRAALLAKALELESRLSFVSELQLELKDVLEAQGVNPGWDTSKISKMREAASEAREVLTTAPRSRFVEHYEDSYHAIQNICLEAEDLEKSFREEITRRRAP